MNIYFNTAQLLLVGRRYSNFSTRSGSIRNIIGFGSFSNRRLICLCFYDLTMIIFSMITIMIMGGMDSAGFGWQNDFCIDFVWHSHFVNGMHISWPKCTQFLEIKLPFSVNIS